MAHFKIDILTPSSVLAKKVEADSMLVPTSTGEINVLPEHTHMVVKLNTGILTLANKGKKEFYSITSGVCKVQGDQVTILSTCSEKADAIDIERAKKALANAKEKLANSQKMLAEEQVKFSRKFDRAEMRLKMSLLNK